MRRHGGGGQEGQEGERSPARPAAGPGRGVGVPPGGRAGGGAAGWDSGQVGLRLAEEVPRLSGGGGSPLLLAPGRLRRPARGPAFPARRAGTAEEVGPARGQEVARTVR